MAFLSHQNFNIKLDSVIQSFSVGGLQSNLNSLGSKSISEKSKLCFFFFFFFWKTNINLYSKIILKIKNDGSTSFIVIFILTCTVLLLLPFNANRLKYVRKIKVFPLRFFHNFQFYFL